MWNAELLQKAKDFAADLSIGINRFQPLNKVKHALAHCNEFAVVVVEPLVVLLSHVTSSFLI